MIINKWKREAPKLNHRKSFSRSRFVKNVLSSTSVVREAGTSFHRNSSQTSFNHE
uniref:Uncharacterized protein n=1 Tax=Rhizophora mucronata TaxID=61149 RepID=A0A2P2QWA8_RHIMU